MADVFLSYSRDDKETMQQVRQVLQRAGLSVWTDEDLAPGIPSWRKAIEDALNHSGCVVVILTPSAKKSDGVRDELDYAQNQEIRIFPVLAGGSKRSAVPFGFISAQWVDIRKELEPGMGQLITAIKNYLPPVRSVSSRQRPLYKEFWTQLLDRSRGRTALFSSVSPRDKHEIRAGASRSGVMYKYALSRTAVTVDLYIDVKDKAKNKALFDALLLQRDAIEADFGSPLEWQRLDNDRASRIRKTVGDRRSFLAQEKWPALQDVMIDALIRLDHALREHLTSLKV